jgi:hypothetical protein
MNEMIKTLFIRAGGGVEEENGNIWTYCEDLDPEKFAQLIVAECVSIVAKRKDQAIDDGCNVDEAMSMAEMDLLEHFGVEE